MVNITKVWTVTLNRDEEDTGIGGNPDPVNLTVNINGEDRFENDYFPSTKRGCGTFSEGFAEPAIDSYLIRDLIFNKKNMKFYCLTTFQVGCISCHPFGLSVTHAPH